MVARELDPPVRISWLRESLHWKDVNMGHGDQNLNLPGGLNFAPDEAVAIAIDLNAKVTRKAGPLRVGNAWVRSPGCVLGVGSSTLA